MLFATYFSWFTKSDHTLFLLESSNFTCWLSWSKFPVFLFIYYFNFSKLWIILWLFPSLLMSIHKVINLMLFLVVYWQRTLLSKPILWCISHYSLTLSYLSWLHHSLVSKPFNFVQVFMTNSRELSSRLKSKLSCLLEEMSLLDRVAKELFLKFFKFLFISIWKHLH